VRFLQRCCFQQFLDWCLKLVQSLMVPHQDLVDWLSLMQEGTSKPFFFLVVTVAWAILNFSFSSWLFLCLFWSGLNCGCFLNLHFFVCKGNLIIFFLGNYYLELLQNHQVHQVHHQYLLLHILSLYCLCQQCQYCLRKSSLQGHPVWSGQKLQNLPT